MKEEDKNLMERYLYEVVRHVKREQREEIAMELRELISDMTETASMEEVLEKLGDPEIFAKRYRDENSYVVGPDYYDTYEWVLKIVFGCVLISVTVSAVVQGITDSSWIVKIVGSLIGDLVISLITSFGGVTLIFAVMERQKVKLELKQKKTWSVEELEKTRHREKSGRCSSLARFRIKELLSKGPTA